MLNLTNHLVLYLSCHDSSYNIHLVWEMKGVDMPLEGDSPSATHQVTLQVRLKVELK